MISKLGYVAIGVPDLEAAVHLYANIFGGFIPSPQDVPAHRARIATLPRIGVEIEVNFRQNTPKNNGEGE